MDTHLYLMCYQTEALIASQLEATDFGSYMAIGTQKKTFGNTAFFEIDATQCLNEFGVSSLEELCKPHSDGSPKRSKYLSVYRVLERVPLSAFGKLHLVTRDGRVLSLEGQTLEPGANVAGDGPYMYAELCPLTPRVVSQLNPYDFCQKLTDQSVQVSVPKLFFAHTQLKIKDDSLASYLPYRNPEHVVACVREVQDRTQKPSKTVDRNPPLMAFYRTVDSGFYLGGSEGVKFYPFPDTKTLDAEHHRWWRSASMG
ncbi:hypothetical protein [Aeoliella mucimassa]|uniref:Uncharacterized protein n=1 Tax=Aeoliella mucimassa TaxID=2527972 RepID=A0A518ASH9_9BACT|nr:hypothetical protein [Aeoliella mucimassa]QDU57682.1 hypothetical protein Pan181_39030 [Aeoliella mucimassa]